MSLTITEMDDLVKDLAEARKLADAAKLQHSALNTVVEGLKGKVLAELEASGMDSFRGNSGTVSRVVKFDVKFPRGDDDKKEAFRAYLQEKGIFDQKWEMNYQSLNAWYTQEVASATEDGVDDFEVPGLDPSSRVTLSFRS